MWYWRRLLRVLWTARRSNQSILKEISPGISLEGMMPHVPVFPVCVCVLIAQSSLTLCSPRTVAFQASLPMGFSRQEYWSGLPFSSPGTQGLNLALLHCWQILYGLSGADSVPGELYMNCRCLSEKKFPFFFFYKDHFKSLY